MTVLVGYRHVPDAPSCPGCGERHFSLHDDGDPTVLAVTCWCGMSATVRRTDPDLARWPGIPPEHLPPR